MGVHFGGRDIGRLSEGQKECLRLVLAHKTSKEIARELQISSHTVDQRIRFANRVLGVRTRMQAAIILNQAEQAASHAGLIYNSDTNQLIAEDVNYSPLVNALMYQPQHIPRSTGFESESPGRSDPGVGLMPEFLPHGVAEERFSFSAQVGASGKSQFSDGPELEATPPPAEGKLNRLWANENVLRWEYRVLFVFLIAALTLMAVGSLMDGFKVLSDLLK